MIRWILFFLFVVLPMMEIGLIVLFSHYIVLSLLLVSQIVSAIAGWFILRPLDINLPFILEAELRKGEKVVREMWEESILILGGVFLFIPGLLTDVLGIAMVYPPVRAKLLRLIPDKL